LKIHGLSDYLKESRIRTEAGFLGKPAHGRQHLNAAAEKENPPRIIARDGFIFCIRRARIERARQDDESLLLAGRTLGRSSGGDGVELGLEIGFLSGALIQVSLNGFAFRLILGHAGLPGIAILGDGFHLDPGRLKLLVHGEQIDAHTDQDEKRYD